MAVYTLPDLPYDYSALEPAISAQVMRLHHDKHHAAYVAGANQALEQIAHARATGGYATITQLQKNLAFNLAGHINHTIFWTNLTPDAPDAPVGEFALAIDQAFGSLGAFRAHFTAVATSIQGSGWAMLAWDPLGARLMVEQVYDHQSNLTGASVPLLVLDMWEHAFYLDYRNVKADYVAAFWTVVNWADVAARYTRALGGTADLIA
ncbi:MAG: superoxide dismutase [Bifidobacteriaceae bacterium]|jgi:Fe-Mn family superoxide dismutase|nr:superoxide dismutase [Bifidobacteriaceae bacterium]